MKVSELLAFFVKEDMDKDILMSSDSEGNSYHPVHEVCTTADGKLVIFPTHEWVDIEEGDDEDEDPQPEPDTDPFEPIDMEEQDASHTDDDSKSA